MKNTKGITLIALIITIIVMLILVAVSISVALNTGLFKSAGDATQNWKTAQDAESKMQIEIDGKKYDSVEDYIAGKESIPEIHNWVRTEDDLTCAHCNKTYTIGQKVNYTKTGTGNSTISGEKSGVSQGILDGKLDAANFGTEGAQTINEDTEIEWIVLGTESSNGDDGTNETLLLTTVTPTTESITLYGCQAYNFAIEEINRMCMEIYGSDARGMTMVDVSECVNYNNPRGMYCNQYGVWSVTDNLTTKLKDLGDKWQGIKENRSGVFYDPKNPNGIKDNGESLGEYQLNAYHYYLSDDGAYLINDYNKSDTNNPITDAEKNVIFGSSKDYNYWLASRGVGVFHTDARFSPGAVSSRWAGSLGEYNMFGTRGTLGSAERRIRPVVSLRTELPEVVE